jgi:hypothetical protein
VHEKKAIFWDFHGGEAACEKRRPLTPFVMDAADKSTTGKPGESIELYRASKNPQGAVKVLQEAAEKGSCGVNFELGVSTLNGVGVPRNEAKSKVRLVQAAPWAGPQQVPTEAPPFAFDAEEERQNGQDDEEVCHSSLPAGREARRSAYLSVVPGGRAIFGGVGRGAQMSSQMISH